MYLCCVWAMSRMWLRICCVPIATKDHNVNCQPVFHITQTLIFISFRKPLFPYYLPNKCFHTHVKVRICFSSSGRLDFELPLIKCLSYPPGLSFETAGMVRVSIVPVMNNEVISLESKLLIMSFLTPNTDDTHIEPVFSLFYRYSGKWEFFFFTSILYSSLIYNF